ncbi:hypothetical protein QTO34_012322 [Cnephaeus nilssonii]|uniref:Uncharacterized protein n=1 Tax=Cnephaeus nilssonii TaxID=3371016 RepID=A0AA40HCH3_CNENI|nr:hypothetical protein QTO34_012322 [Eptesicus nilssonii]
MTVTGTPLGLEPPITCSTIPLWPMPAMFHILPPATNARYVLCVSPGGSGLGPGRWPWALRHPTSLLRIAGADPQWFPAIRAGSPLVPKAGKASTPGFPGVGLGRTQRPCYGSTRVCSLAMLAMKAPLTPSGCQSERCVTTMDLGEQLIPLFKKLKITPPG